MNDRNQKLRSLASDGVLIIYFLFVLFPILWMVLTSFKRTDELYTTRFIFHPTLESYKVIMNLQTEFVQGTGSFRTDFPRFFLNSVILAVGAVAVSLAVGVPAAYALARFRFKGKESLAFTFLSFRFAPAFAVIIPLSIIYKRLGIYNTYGGIIWVFQLITLPLLIWVLRGYFEEISPEIEQAAMTDGYPWWQVFIKILLPLVRPGLAASALLAFVFAWNNFVFPMVLGGSEVQTVTVSALSFLSSAQAYYNRMAAACVLASLPEIILALTIQRYLIRGLSFGAVKG